MTSAENRNSFSLGSQVGGPDMREASVRQEQRLRDAFNRWSGDYTSAIRKFAFLLRIDGAIHKYTELWNILGAQPPKQKKDWIEVEIGVPQDWWRDDKAYKKHLVREVEKGLYDIILLLQGKKRAIRADALLKDWDKIKTSFLQDD